LPFEDVVYVWLGIAYQASQGGFREFTATNPLPGVVDEPFGEQRESKKFRNSIADSNRVRSKSCSTNY